MSRSFNTAPYPVQERRLVRKGEGWRFTGYPARIGGCQGGHRGGIRSEKAHEFEVVFRQQVREALHHGREPPQRVVHRVRWWIW